MPEKKFSLLIFKYLFCFCFVFCSLKIVILVLLHFSDQYSIIHFSTSKNGNIWVYETSTERCMNFEHPNIARSREACMFLHKPSSSVFQYEKMLLGSLYINPHPKKILILGLGGGSLVKKVSYLLPESKIDVVEINPEVVKIAKKFFFFEETNNIKIFIEDGYNYINHIDKNNKKYDSIIIDISSTHSTLQRILSIDFFQMIKKATNENGVIAINILFSNISYSLKAFFDVFDNVYNLVYNKNHVMLAKIGSLPTQSDLEENARNWNHLFQKLEIDQKWLLNKFSIIQNKAL